MRGYGIVSRTCSSLQIQATTRSMPSWVASWIGRKHGHIGEWIAARIFDIELETAGNAAGYDGHFTTGALLGQTVNVKPYTRQQRILDMKSTAPLDYYLVFTGPRGAAVSSRVTLRPFCIDAAPSGSISIPPRMGPTWVSRSSTGSKLKCCTASA